MIAGSPSISAYSMDTFKDKLSLKETAGSYFSRKVATGGPGAAAAAAAAAGGGGVGTLSAPAAAGASVAHPALGPPEVAMVANSGETSLELGSWVLVLALLNVNANLLWAMSYTHLVMGGIKGCHLLGVSCRSAECLHRCGTVVTPGPSFFWWL